MRRKSFSENPQRFRVICCEFTIRTQTIQQSAQTNAPTATPQEPANAFQSARARLTTKNARAVNRALRKSVSYVMRKIIPTFRRSPNRRAIRGRCSARRPATPAVRRRSSGRGRTARQCRSVAPFARPNAGTRILLDSPAAGRHFNLYSELREPMTFFAAGSSITPITCNSSTPGGIASAI
jgi:hypothetical protein